MLARIFAALMLGLGSAAAQGAGPNQSVFEMADINGNARISAAEYGHFQRFLFLMIDQNSDGRISAIEWRDWDPREFVGASEGAVGKLVAAMARQFVAYDTDKDDVLSPEEFVSGIFVPFGDVDRAQDGLDAAEFTEAFRLPQQLAD